MALLDSLPQIPVSPTISSLILETISHIAAARRASAAGDLSLSVVSARGAASTADRAFFHPSLMAQEYFPEDQRYAVYVPLFVPLLVPIVAAALRDVKNRRRKESEAKKND